MSDLSSSNLKSDAATKTTLLNKDESQDPSSKNAENTKGADCACKNATDENTKDASAKHDEQHDDHHESGASKSVVNERYKKLVILAGFASVGTAILLILMKFVVWMMSGSATILASLTDSLIDLGASFINLLALRYALAPADKDHRFGHFKAEALASLSQSAFICGSALLLIINGYDRLVKPQPIGYIDIAIYVSIASIVLTVLLTFFQGYVCKLTGSEAIEADRFHYLSDVGLNLSVIVSLVLSRFGYDWSDGLITILLGIYIMKSSFHIGKTAVNTLLDRSLSMEDNNKIMRAILSVDGIDSFHDLRTRAAGPQYYIQCHIVLKRDMPLDKAHDLADKAEHNILKHFPDADISLHMEPEEDKTFRDITFIDSQYCEVPDDHYIKCDVPETLYRKIKEHEAKQMAATQD